MEKMFKKRLYLSHQYYIASLNIMDALLLHKNKNCVVSDREISDKELFEATRYSSSSIICPLLFCFYQTIELYLKAFVYYHVDGKHNHDTNTLLKLYKEYYPQQKGTIKRLEFYLSMCKCKIRHNNIHFIRSFCLENKISDNKTLYNSLRYPDKADKEVLEYILLQYFNPSVKLNQIKNMRNDLKYIISKGAILFREMEDLEKQNRGD